MKICLLICSAVTIAFFCGAVYCQTSSVKLEIIVMKQTTEDKTTKPFVGVGVFDLLRGTSKLEGGLCPDKSSTSGRVNCSIPCQMNQDDMPITIRVRPPSDQDHLAGWVTPAPQDIELHGCKLVPQRITMKYEDARFALNKQIIKLTLGYRARPITTSDDKVWVGLMSDRRYVIEIATRAIASINGTNDLQNIYRFAIEGEKAYALPRSRLPEEQKQENLALEKWQILSKSALLGSQIEKVFPENRRMNIEEIATTDVRSYLTSLKKADTLLSGLKEKNPEQHKLSDDIKTLLSMPATGKDSQAALSVIQEWR